MRGARLGVALALLLGLASPAAGAPAEEASPEREVAIRVDSPPPGREVRAPVHQARIAGSVIAKGEAPPRFDVMLAIDVSNSTRIASGSDVDGDGTVGFNPHVELVQPGEYPEDVLSTDPEDTVLHAEIAAARRLLEGLDPERVRVGVLSFAGEVDPLTGRRKRVDQQDAWLEQPLTDDYAQVERTLRLLRARGSRGATNFSAGVRLGVRELAGLSEARSRPRADARKVILFLTDGAPTLPHGRGNETDTGDEEAAVRAAKLARKAGVTLNTYALGPGALTYPESVTEMARVTNGVYTPVQNPGEIVTLIEGVTFADVEDVVLANVTTGELSTDVRLHPDGTFEGYVPVREGENHVRVSALASDGSRGQVEFDFSFEKARFGDREPMEELERIRQQNKELELRRLELEIEAFREEQRKELEIERAPED